MTGDCKFLTDHLHQSHAAVVKGRKTTSVFTIKDDGGSFFFTAVRGWMPVPCNLPSYSLPSSFDPFDPCAMDPSHAWASLLRLRHRGETSSPLL